MTGPCAGNDSRTSCAPSSTRVRAIALASLVESVWHGSPPDDEVGALQALVARVRRTGLAVVTTTDCYRLPLDGLTVDVLEAKALLARGRRDLGAGSPSTALDAARQARALFDDPAAAASPWASTPTTPSLSDGHVAAPTVRLLADVVALRTEAALSTGEVDALDDLRALALRTPPDEPLVAVLSGGIGDDLRTLVLGRRTAVRVLAEDSDRLSAGVRSLLLALHVTLEAAVTLDVSALLPATAALVEGPDPRLRGLGHLLRSGAHENLGDVARSLEDARAAFDQFELTGNRWVMAIAARGLGLWESGPGGTGPDRWLIVAQENFELVGAAQDARSIAVARVVKAAVRGDFDARPALEEVVISGAHDVSTRAQALSGLAALDAVSGRWDEAIARADQAVTLASETGSGSPHARVLYQAAAALMRIRSGRPGAVREGNLLLARALPDALTSAEATARLTTLLSGADPAVASAPSGT